MTRIVVTSASGANGDGYGALLCFSADGRLAGPFSEDRRITDPRGLSLSPAGDLVYVASGDDRVLALDQNGTVVLDSGRTEGLDPGGGTFAPDGRYCVTLRHRGTILALPPGLDTEGERLLPDGSVPFPRGFGFGAGCGTGHAGRAAPAAAAARRTRLPVDASGPPATSVPAACSGHWLSGTSPAAAANNWNAAATAACRRAGTRPRISAMRSRRRAVAWSTTCLPAAVIDTWTSRRSERARCRRIRPLRTSRSHIRPAVGGVTPSARARSTCRCGPRDASTTSARYCASVVSSAAAPSDCSATATSVRLAVSTASTTSSGTSRLMSTLASIIYSNDFTYTLSPGLT
jgi:hypothetical protein